MCTDEEERKRIRDESTVFVSQIHPKVKERDLFDFFSLVGRVNDVISTPFFFLSAILLTLCVSWIRMLLI
jgi:RNA recognition motif-containing protein